MNQYGRLMEVQISLAFGLVALAIAVPEALNGNFFKASLWGLPGLACLGAVLWYKISPRLKSIRRSKGGSPDQP